MCGGEGEGCVDVSWAVYKIRQLKAVSFVFTNLVQGLLM